MKHLIFALAAVFGITSAAHAYVGPGLATGLLGTVLGILGSVFLVVFAVVWYPLKKLFRKLWGKDLL